MTLSIGVVTNEHRELTHTAEISELATEMKATRRPSPAPCSWSTVAPGSAAGAPSEPDGRMNATCPHCGTVYRIDPAQGPGGGRARPLLGAARASSAWPLRPRPPPRPRPRPRRSRRPSRRPKRRPSRTPVAPESPGVGSLRAPGLGAGLRRGGPAQQGTAAGAGARLRHRGVPPGAARPQPRGGHAPPGVPRGDPQELGGVRGPGRAMPRRGRRRTSATR